MSEADWGEELNPSTGELDAPTPENPEGAPELRFATLPDFVEQYLVLIYQRDLDIASNRWCTKWWYHAEAIARLEAMWRAWELLRLDPGEGGSNWWLSHADPHMRVLLSENGPFRHCRKGLHAEDGRLSPLPVEVVPDDLRSAFG
ncbi:DUF4913 domain-containing protein [Leifsonia sp. H3M29-4]|uniref:DUF4913 domain-containing protein n=1 Tax=Salinibacterium metalliresistens TaxID=3031321 RepID=UPI0023DCE652|nr:DUF4913 domain-containing protein [Salinibacterium metalliresistens]MDF1480337.1 DUF4913 domain-containing protein [Salinibacterium metalliresistens]